MFNLFETKRLCQIGDDDADVSVQLATFASVEPDENRSGERSTTGRFNLVLYCADYRLLLIQLQKDSDHQEPRWRHITIPLDQQKGPITSMSMSQQGDRLLAITSHSIIYEIPFAFRSFYDPVIQSERTVIDEDAKVIRCCSLKNPTAIVWWQRDPRYFVERRSMAIVGDDSGRLAMIDLEREYEFGRTSIPFAIKSLSIYDEMYNRSLLITCNQGFQYQMVLEEFRNILSRNRFDYSVTSSPSKNDSNSNSSLLNNFNNYYLSCLLNLPMENDHEVLGKTSREDPIQETTEALRPQLITFNNEIDIQTFLAGSDADPRSPDIQNAATVASEFFFFTDHDLTSGVHKSSTAKMAIHPQATPVCGSYSNIFVVKHRNAKIQLGGTLSSNSTKSIGHSGGSSNDADESMNSDDSSEFFMVDHSEGRTGTGCSKYSSKSSDFCNISLSHTDQLWEVYEYAVPNFCTKTILFSSAKLFAINLDPAPETEMIRLIDCSYRFLLLAFQDRCFLVSKTFSEQTKPTGPSSPRSPLFLRRSDSSGHRRGLGGSFRRKTSPSPGQNLPLMSVIDEFPFENIVDVFLLSPGTNRLGIREYLQKKVGQSLTSMEMLADLDVQARHERRLVQVLASDDIQDETIVVDEQFLVVTKTGVYLLQSREESFARFFHQEIESLVVGAEETPTPDGDLISKAKLMVDCFATGSKSPKQPQNSPQHIPSQAWQLWLSRSALLLMRSMAEKLESWPEENRTRLLSLGQLSPTDLDLAHWLETRLRHAYRLLELSRSSRKRVVVALNYFRYWYRTIDQVKKFFQTRVVFEISEEERAFLADQLLEALVAIRWFYDQIQDRENLLEADQKLYRFLFESRTYYNAERTLQKLVDEQLLEMAEYLALLSGNYAHFCHFILRQFPPNAELPKPLRNKILELLTSGRVTYALIISTDYLGPRSISLIETYLQFMFHHLPHLSRRFLRRLAWVFDPRRLSVRLMLNQTLEYCHQTYLCHQYEEIHDRSNESLEASLITPTGRLRPTLLPITRRDLLNLHLFVDLLYQRKVLRKRSMYDWTFIETTAPVIESFLNARKSSIIITPRQESNVEPNFSDWHVAAGTYCSVAYNQDHFYLWGKFDYVHVCQDNVKSLQLSPGVESTTHKLRTPTLNRFFSSVVDAPIRSISVGHQHLMILTTVGMFGLGSSNFGQLGLGPMVLMSRYPALLDFRRSLCKVVCGSYHTLAITDDRQLYSWGWALHGQLGHGSTEDEFKPKLVRFFIEQNLKVKDCAAGYAHSAGDLYVFGENSYGQVGVAEPGIISTDQTSGKSKFSVPQRFGLLGTPVKLVTCGLFHTVAVTKSETGNEKLFCWGIDPKTWRLKMRSDRSQASRKRSPSPVTDLSGEQCNNVFDYAKIREVSLARLPDGACVKKLSAGQSHTLLLTDQHGIYAFGYGREGQLGCSVVRSPSNNSNRQCSDEVMPVLEDREFLDVACGAFHSLVLDSRGNIWGWGQTSNYQLSSSTDDLPTSGGNQNEDEDSPMRSNRSPNLFNPNSTSIVNQMILASPKNCRWSPTIIMSLEQAINALQNSIEPRKRTVEEFPNVPLNDNVNIGEKFRRKIIAFLVFALDDLEVSSLIRRFEQLDLHQLSAIACWIHRDHIGWLKYQFEALKQEIGKENSDKLVSEISKLLRFILEQNSFKNPGSRTGEILRLFLSFWQQLGDNRPDFVSILNEVYLSENAASDPFFGLYLLKLLREQEESHREKLGLTDQLLLDLVKRTEDLLVQHPEAIPAVQMFFSESLDLKQVFKCPNEEVDQGPHPPALPYSIKYQSLIAQFGEDHGDDLDEPNNNHEPNDELEIRIPSDIEDEETPLLLVFKCGHYVSLQEFRHELKRLMVDEDPRAEWYRGVSEKLFSGHDLPEPGSSSSMSISWANDLKEMDCINCTF